jgi:ferredoxin
MVDTVNNRLLAAINEVTAMKNDHPTIRAFQAQSHYSNPPGTIDRKTLEDIARECGADDVGIVRLDRKELDDDRPFILRAFPQTQTLVCIVVRMHPPAIRSTARSLANHEFHAAGDETSQVARRIVDRLEDLKIPALSTAVGFPMEMSEFPGRTWIVSHKVVAEAAGLGKMGIHRNIIHPVFGNFILLNTVLVGAEVSDESEPLDYNPCLECKLCVAACPVGAISSDGHFDAISCLNHNYREFMGGFIDWVKIVADSPNSRAYEEKASDQETASLWQSLSFGANYKSAYCMAVCPAGEDVIGPFLSDKAGFVRDVLNPLQEKSEPVYVVADTDAEYHAAKRFPHKVIRRIRSGVMPTTLKRLVGAMPLVFQRGRSKGISATYHFRFTGAEPMNVTFAIASQKLTIETGHLGKADLQVTVDSTEWLKFVAKRRSLPRMLATRTLRFRGNPRLLADFGRCFPS